MKSTLALLLVFVLAQTSVFATGVTFSTPPASAPESSASIPPTTSSSVLKVLETVSGTGETVVAQDELNLAISKLVLIYETRVTRLQDEINRLRIENNDLRAQLNSQPSTTNASAPVADTLSAKASTPTASGTGKTEAEKRYDAIMSNVTVSLPEILKKNKITATGSIGLFEFIEPKSFFISIDDGKNPAGVTAFKTKILFEYDKNFNLTVTGVFDLDLASQRYVTLRGSNPFAGAVRVRVKNPTYAGKLLEEVATSTGGTLSAGITAATVTRPTATTANTGAAATSLAAPLAAPTAPATLDDIRKAYDKNKLGDAITMADSYLQKNPNNVEVLTMRARSQYIFGKYTEALNDISTIYKIQGDAVDCGIVNDGARAEKALKGASGSTFGGLQNTKCKK